VPNILSTSVLHPNDILVSNFNNSNNLQGTGTTIVRVTTTGQVSQFFEGQAPGLTAALGVLSNGIVIVGSLPTTDGTSATVQAGGLVVIDHSGNQLGFIANPAINGPWGMAVNDQNNGTAQIFVSNVLAGTVVRLDVSYAHDGTSMYVNAITTIGSGFTHRTDPAALVLGPSGLFYDQYHDVLYVASSTDNAVYTLAGAGAATSSIGSGNPADPGLHASAWTARYHCRAERPPAHRQQRRFQRRPESAQRIDRIYLGRPVCVAVLGGGEQRRGIRTERVHRVMEYRPRGGSRRQREYAVPVDHGTAVVHWGGPSKT
jgi:hypothetical protein